MAFFVEFAFYKNEGLGATCEPSSFCLVHRQRVTEEVVKVECSLVVQRVELYRRFLFKLHDLGARGSRWLVSPWGWIRRAIVGPFQPFVAYQGLMLVAGEDAHWHRLLTGRCFCKCVGRLVEAPWDVVEFEAMGF